ncbi:MAG TPA: alpha-L-arabinofuranosidase C-terminal domain-containing protein [Pirellulales bacterium]|jgi:alpha-L-arabinofuranosidase|nr:alpha-L-arabinofuranosidase C-terminal domain-containing protein [Pirellulales bacterium]
MNQIRAIIAVVVFLAPIANAAEPAAAIKIDAGKVLNHVTPLMYGSCIEDVNHEIFGGLYAQMIFGESFEEPPAKNSTDGLSGMWDAVQTGEATPRFTWDADRPINSARSQKIELLRGEGTVGVANRGLNRWGLTFREGRTYSGLLYLRQIGYDGAVTVALQSADGKQNYAAERLAPIGADWKRYEFNLKSSGADTNARFAVWIDKPGACWVDQVFLSGTGDELFHNLPIRGDIGRMLQDQGLTVLRYGGCMVNAPGYRWKNMLGNRDRRPQYKGWWYPQSTNGFGIEEFLQFCEAAKFEKVFAINIEESPEDAADMVEYLNGPATSQGGARRAASGHLEPYRVKYIEIGNEETTGNHYLERFKLLYESMHARDPSIQFIIAAWWEPDNPAARRIVQELDGKAALWDVHIGGDDLREGRRTDALFTRMEKLVHDWAPNSKLKACVLEENGGRHDVQRALGHACVLNATQRHGDFVLMDCPANCLQPWKQNDNGWDQGQVFFTSGQVWAMPPFYAQQMATANHLPCRVASEVKCPNDELDVTATRGEDGSTLVMKIVNIGDHPHRASIEIAGLGPVDPHGEMTSLSGKLKDVNLPDSPDRIRSIRSSFEHAGERFDYEFPEYSYTVLKLKRKP